MINTLPLRGYRLSCGHWFRVAPGGAPAAIGKGGWYLPLLCSQGCGKRHVICASYGNPKLRGEIRMYEYDDGSRGFVHESPQANITCAAARANPAAEEGEGKYEKVCREREDFYRRLG